MKYSGYIDGLLAEAAFAKKTGDISWMQKMRSVEVDPIKRLLLHEVCNEQFISQVKRNSEWFSEQKNRLECLALEQIQEDETEQAIEQASRSLQKKDKKEEEEQQSKKPKPADIDELKSILSKLERENIPILTDEEDGDEGIPIPSHNDEKSESGPIDSDVVNDMGQEDNGTDDEDGNDSAPSRDTEDSEDASDWEKMRKEALDKFKEQLNQSQMEKAMGDSLDLDMDEISSFGIGMANDVITEMENETLRRIPKSLKRLARVIGRSGGFDVEQGKTFSRASKSDISGITVGNDLNSLLPSEIAVLSDRRTQDIFYKNYAEKRLQVFASASSGQQKKERQDGPVIICLDTSSSMNGEPAKIARMLAIAVSIYAMRRRRKVFIVKYSDKHYYQTFTRRGSDRKRLMDFLRWKGTGGNNENDMFKDLFTNLLPKEPAFSSADILCISDFGWYYIQDEVKKLIQQAKDGGMIFYGLAVGAGNWMGFHHEDSINYCDSKWQWINGECVNIDDKCKKSEGGCVDAL